MVKNAEVFDRFEKKLLKKSKDDYKRNFKIVESLYRHARKLRKFPSRNKLEGIEIDIKIAKILNSVR